MKNILILDIGQYGYNASTFNYAKYLRGYKINFLTIYTGREKIPEENCSVKYLPKYNFRALNLFFFLLNSIIEIRKGYTAVLTLWFPFCSLLKLTNEHNIILDIRTGFVRSPNKKINSLLDNFIRFDSRFFHKICFISDYLASQFSFKVGTYTVSSVGSPEMTFTQKSNKKLKLLYVGTLENRNIHETVIGLNMAVQKMGKEIDLKYTIVGDSSTGNEKSLIKDLITKYDLSKFIKLEGYVPRNRLEVFFQNNNVGVSYVPVIDYYNNQPPTKTFEYLSSGMPVIATNNNINKEIIDINNGILIDSDANSFCNAVIEIYENLDKYDFKNIYDTSSVYHWEDIVRNNIQPIILEN